MALTRADLVYSATEAVKQRLGGRQPVIGMILGSGLGELARQIIDPITIPYADVPHMPASTVAGHAGRFVCGQFEGHTVLMMQGRVHYYEGYPMGDLVLPVYVMKELGVKTLIVTNAAGGMNPLFQPGDVMLISDHINWTGDHPLIGPNDARLGLRFHDMSAAYDPELLTLATQVSVSVPELRLRVGVYAAISGPAYLTPGELRLLARVGADAVGMSTVAEVIAARHAGLRVLGFSCITDMAIADHLEPLSHEQVLAVAERTKPAMVRWLHELLRVII